MSKVAEQLDLNEIDDVDSLAEELRKIFVELDLVDQDVSSSSTGDSVSFKTINNAAMRDAQDISYNSYGLPDAWNFISDGRQGEVRVTYTGFLVDRLEINYPAGKPFARYEVTHKSDGLRIDNVNLELFQN